MAEQTTPMVPTEADVMRAVHEHQRWFLILGIALILLGIAAIVFPFIATLSATFFVGWLLVISGIVQIIHAFGFKDWRGFAWELLIGILQTLAGVALLVFPLAGIVALTIFLAAIFLVEGIMRTLLAFKIKPQSGWGWMLAGGIVSAIVGVLLWAELPASAVWAIGLLVGINLLMAGWALVMLAMSARDTTHEGQAAKA